MNSKRYSSIDQLRFIAAITVAISHLIISSTGNNLKLEIISSISVEVFFIISGFVLAPQILKITNSSKINDYKIFLIRRWYRTIPLYILSLVLTSIILNKIFTFDFLKYLFFIQNFLVIFVNVDYFSISWSLSVEEWFYIILPLFIFISSYLKDKIIKLNVLTICLIIIIALNIFRFFYNSESIDWGEDIRRSVILRIDSICFGVVAFILKEKISKIFLLIIFIFCFILLFFYLINPSVLLNYKLSQNFFLPICAVCFSSLLILFTFKDTNSLKIKKISSLGANLSYSMYLFHIFFIPITINFFNNIIFALIAYLLLLKLFCFFFFISFEKPLLKSRPRYE